MSVTATEPLAETGALRLLPAPCSEPPYDDELPAQPALRLVAGAPGPLQPAPKAAPPRLRVVPDAAPELLGLVDGPTPRTPSADLPAPRPFAHALVQRVLEIRAGVRPMLQLQRDTSPELFLALETRMAALPRQTGARPTRADVRSLHVQQRPDGVAEVCATVRRGSRMRALALRLEGQRGRWVCTELAWL